MIKLNFIKVSKNVIFPAITMIFAFFSFWICISPLTAFAEDYPKTITMYPGMGTNATPDSSLYTNWTNPNKIIDSGLTYAYVELSSNSSSSYLKGSNYNFSDIPAGAKIDKVQVDIKLLASDDMVIQDSVVRLVNKDGIIVGTNKAIPTRSAAWPNVVSSRCYIWSASELSDAGLNLDDIKNPSFGVVLSVKNTDNINARRANVDYISVTIFYTPDTTAPKLTLLQETSSTTYGSVTVTPSASDSSGINETSYKYALGEKSIEYFATNGEPFTTSFDVSASGTYTVYVSDRAGNKAISTISVVISVPTISVDTNVITVNQNPDYGIMYFLSTATVPEGYKIYDCGVIISKDISSGLNMDYKLGLLQAPPPNSKGQFYSGFKVIYGLTLYVRPYIVYENLETHKTTPIYYGNIVSKNITI